MKHQPQRHLGFVLAGLFAVLALWPAFTQGQIAATWLAAFATTLTLTALTPQLLTPFSRLWYALGHLLGELNTRLLLAVIFFVLITPMGLVARGFGHDPLKLRRLQPGYWQARPDDWQRDSFKDQF